MPSNAPPVVRLPVTKFRTKKSYKTLTGLLRDFRTKNAERILWDDCPALPQKRARGDG
jgi:hypothetical protein